MRVLKYRRDPAQEFPATADERRWCSGSSAHLVEAVGTIDGLIVSRQEWDERLSATLGTHGGVHLPLASAVPVSAPDAQRAILLRDRSTALTALRLVDQALARVELLFAR